jgi:hypothetical protein
LLSPIYREGIQWGSRDFKWEGNRAVGDSSKFWHRLYLQLG